MFLEGKTALITGSTSGIGGGYAKALAAEGAAVMINGFGDAGEIEALRQELEALSGTKAAYSSADMAKPEEIRQMCSDCAEQLGSVDILINNAGIQFVSPVDEFPEEKWNAVMDIIMNSAFHATKAVLPGMKEKG
ncbi:MAG: SDR family NAD(P)-dependent oxidoreductase, partial [Sphingorhabdus sp.]